MKKIFFQITAAVLLFVCSLQFSFALNTSAQTPVITYVPQSTYLSQVKTAPIEFTGLGVKWHQKTPAGSSAQIFIRVQNQNIWTDWHLLEPDIDGTDSANPEYPISFLPVNLTKTFQYKVVLRSQQSDKTPLIENIEFTYINGAENKKIADAQEGLVAALKTRPQVEKSVVPALPPTPIAKNGLKIISRAQWGADESLRLYQPPVEAQAVAQAHDDNEKDSKKIFNTVKIVKVIENDANGQPLRWPLEYPQKINKIIIHHTATGKDLDDPKTAIQSIYKYHIFARKWGDIGYNYIIDPKGNIYEGRYGGDSVVGGHAWGANVGSIGIAVLGNYQQNAVPEPVLKSLAALIKEKTGQYGIDPLGSSVFGGENMPNIMGHRDTAVTACPGEKLYAQLPMLRLAVKNGLKPFVIDRGKNLEINKKYHFEPQGNDGTIAQLSPASNEKIRFTVKNSGQTTWGKGTFFALNRDENARNFFVTDTLIQSDPLTREIKPNESVTIELNLQTSYKGGLTMVEFFPMIDGNIKVEKYLSMPVQITSAVLDYEVQGLDFKTPSLKKGTVSEATLTLKNTGNIIWKKSGKNKFVLGSDNPRDHVNRILLNPGNRLAELSENEVLPGQTGHFKILIKAPNLTGPYREYFTPLLEGISWLPNKKTYLDLFVYEKDYKSEYDAYYQKSKSDAIRIDLSFRGNPVLSADGPFALQNEGKDLATFKKDEKVSVRYEQGVYKVTAGVNNFSLATPPRFYSAQKAILRIENFERKASWNPAILYNEFRGVLEPHWYQNELHVINELPLEDYLKGTGEINEKEPQEKLRAIIVVARSYANYYMKQDQKFPGAPFHLTDDPEKSQKYVGYSAEKRAPITTKAVNDTAGQVVTYQGKPVKTPYFSSDDGRTRSAEEVWGWKSTPYLKSVDDPYCAGKKLSGHGVGLSGCGSLGMAKAGKTYQEILRYYYQGIEITKIK
jgi:hypothetical protein